MIIQSQFSRDWAPYERQNTLALRKLVESRTQQTSILERRPKQGPKVVSAARRAKRNNFFKQVTQVWKARNPNAGGAFTALALLYTPWENWNGLAIRPTPLQMYQIYMSRFYELWLAGVFNILQIDTGSSPWPTDWPAPVQWGIPTIDYNFSPPRILWPYSATLNIQRVCLLTVYLASPPTKTTTDPFATSLRTWTNNAPLLARTPTLYTWQFPDEPMAYPYKLPNTQTRCAIRPNDGGYLSPQTGKNLALPFSSTVQRFYLDRPAP